MVEIEKPKELTHTDLLDVTFTSMILSLLDNDGYPSDCISKLLIHCCCCCFCFNAVVIIGEGNQEREEAREERGAKGVAFNFIRCIQSTEKERGKWEEAQTKGILFIKTSILLQTR